MTTFSTLVHSSRTFSPWQSFTKDCRFFLSADTWVFPDRFHMPVAGHWARLWHVSRLSFTTRISGFLPSFSQELFFAQFWLRRSLKSYPRGTAKVGPWAAFWILFVGRFLNKFFGFQLEWNGWRYFPESHKLTASPSMAWVGDFGHGGAEMRI